MDEKSQQELFYKLSFFEQHFNQLQQQMQAVEQAVIELQELELGLNELKNKKDGEIFAPIGKGIFMKAKLSEEELLVDIGGKNFVKKSVDETQKIISEQTLKLENIKNELAEELDKVRDEMQGLIDGIQEEHVCNDDCEH